MTTCFMLWGSLPVFQLSTHLKKHIRKSAIPQDSAQPLCGCSKFYLDEIVSSVSLLIRLTEDDQDPFENEPETPLLLWAQLYNSTILSWLRLAPLVDLHLNRKYPYQD